MIGLNIGAVGMGMENNAPVFMWKLPITCVCIRYVKISFTEILKPFYCTIFPLENSEFKQSNAAF